MRIPPKGRYVRIVDRGVLHSPTPFTGLSQCAFVVCSTEVSLPYVTVSGRYGGNCYTLLSYCRYHHDHHRHHHQHLQKLHHGHLMLLLSSSIAQPLSTSTRSSVRLLALPSHSSFQVLYRPSVSQTSQTWSVPPPLAEAWTAALS